MPREIQPVYFGLQRERLLPIDPPCHGQPLLWRSIQIERVEVGAFGIDSPLQLQAHRALISRQAGMPINLVTGVQVPFGCEHQAIELQGIGQRSASLEGLAGNPQLGRQVSGKRLQLATDLCVQVTAAAAIEIQGL